MDQRACKGIKSIEIKVYGVVQGVGFRPFVAQLADRYNVKGEVSNVGGYVAMIASGEEGNLQQFVLGLDEEKPVQAAIIHLEVQEIEERNYETFSIVQSEACEGAIVMLPVDLPVCDQCMEEIQDQGDRRYEHPLISCMACGPRYSIIKSLPYDRDNTTMNPFEMCPRCQEEYTNRMDRRYHAQTISCQECGPYLMYNDSKSQEVIGKSALLKTVFEIKREGLVAIKGVGGYHLACTPFKPEAVQTLREMKGREAKPLAVMFRNIDEVKQYCVVSEEEAKLLTSTARPIVLVSRKPSPICEGVYGHSSELGAFLPYTPVQHMLLDYTGPLVMTSANATSRPIIKDKEELLPFFEKGLKGILDHQRAIWARLDDSVAKVVDKKVQMIRRSRGYVPTPLYVEEELPRLLGMGAQLKATFALGKSHFIYPSDYFGDLEDEETIEWYKERLTEFSQLMQIEPEVVVCDLHPGYVTSDLAKQMNKPILEVQHHHAHIGSVMVEHHLDQVIGVALDGTGYGNDGAIWGGEFFVCQKGGYERKGHLEYVTLLGGDISMKDAAKTATCYLLQSGLGKTCIDGRKDIISAALQYGVNTFLCSSMGRLFDGVSSILGICHENQFEGECAIRLEECAKQALEAHKKPLPLSFHIQDQEGCCIVSYKELIEQLVWAKERGEDVGTIALGFHGAVVEMITYVAQRLREQTGIEKVALSGGVFQNRLLLEGCTKSLGQKGYEVFTNEKVPPNDSGIALGQVYIGAQILRGE